MEGDMREAWPIVICRQDPNCKGCFYYRGGEGYNGKEYGIKMCMFWAIEDKLRGCPPGKGCDKYTKRKPTKKELRSPEMKVRKVKWDRDYGYKLWLSGKSACEIARLCCVSKAAVNSCYATWRKQAESEGIERNYARTYSKTWNGEKAYKMYVDGFTSGEIAAELQVGHATVGRAVQRWRDKDPNLAENHYAAYNRRRKKCKPTK